MNTTAARSFRAIVHSKLLFIALISLLLVGGVAGGMYYARYRQMALTARDTAAKPEAALATPTPVAATSLPGASPLVSTAPPASPSTPSIRPDVKIPTTSKGIAPVVTRVATKQPVVFLTIDDGALRQPDFAQYVKSKGLKVTLFLADAFIAPEPQYFKSFTADGAYIENHTISHDIAMSRKSLAYQQQEICGMSDRLERYYGRRPVLFRPPGGSYTQATQIAAAQCGIKAIVHWHAKVNGGAIQYQEGSKLLPGDIVLMHFRPAFKADIDAFVAEINRQGLHTEYLEEWM